MGAEACAPREGRHRLGGGSGGRGRISHRRGRRRGRFIGTRKNPRESRGGLCAPRRRKRPPRLTPAPATQTKEEPQTEEKAPEDGSDLMHRSRSEEDLIFTSEEPGEGAVAVLDGLPADYPMPRRKKNYDVRTFREKVFGACIPKRKRRGAAGSRAASRPQPTVTRRPVGEDGAGGGKEVDPERLQYTYLGESEFESEKLQQLQRSEDIGQDGDAAFGRRPTDLLGVDRSWMLEDDAAGAGGAGAGSEAVKAAEQPAVAAVAQEEPKE